MGDCGSWGAGVGRAELGAFSQPLMRDRGKVRGSVEQVKNDSDLLREVLKEENCINCNW